MRLINTTSLELEEFDSTEGLRYAILSHRWGAEEVLFADMQPSGQPRKKRGFEKLENFCTRAAISGFKYTWIDTCCIDKSSSSELSEAINSMWHWYKNAEICYVYLADVTASTIQGLFPWSEWFERGWTLQELLAPSNVDFYNADWTFLGTKSMLSGPISRMTGIPEIVVQGRKSIQQYCIAERMSWASLRKTTRIEDRAYSLLGIFDVNMPLLYGEADKAFIRLQEEILKDSNDQTIFEWTEPAIDHFKVPSNLPPTGLLAGSPHSFRHWQGKFYEVTSGMSGKLFPHTITSCGLMVRFELLPYKCGIFVALLDYLRGSAQRPERPCIFLRMLNFQQQFARVAVDERHLIMFSELDDATKNLSLSKESTRLIIQRRELYVPQKRYKLYNSAKLGLIEPLICSMTFKAMPNRVHDALQTGQSYHGQFTLSENRAWMETDRPGTLGLLNLKFKEPILKGSSLQTDKDSSYQILLGLDADLNPICVIVNEDKDKFDAALANSRNEIVGANRIYDVSEKQLQDINCMEPEGWYTFGGDEQYDGSNIVKPNPHRPGFWAFRMKGWPPTCHHVKLEEGAYALEILTRLASSRFSCSVTLRQLHMVENLSANTGG